MNGCFSANEVYSLDDIATEFNLEPNNPLLYGLYLARNPELEHEEKEYIKCYMDKLINKQRKINQINLNYMTQHLQKQN